MILLLNLFILSSFASEFLINCPDCKCPENSVMIKENFRVPRPVRIESKASCINVADNLLKSASCMIEKNMEMTIEQNCTSLEVVKKCPELSSTIPTSFAAGDVAPGGCGYDWKEFDYEHFFETAKNFKSKDEIDCVASMCTAATFLAWVGVVKDLHARGKINDEKFLEMTTPGKKAYRIINYNAEPNKLVEHFGVGKGSVQYVSEGNVGKGNVPKKGDLLQIWRNNGSGHSVVFKGFIDNDKDGEPDVLCYWSSQPSTKGYANNCETISTMDRILIGSLDV